MTIKTAVTPKETKILLKTEIKAEFIYSQPPVNDYEELARKRLNANLDEATQRIQGTVRALLMEMTDILQKVNNPKK